MPFLVAVSNQLADLFSDLLFFHELPCIHPFLLDISCAELKSKSSLSSTPIPKPHGSSSSSPHENICN